MNALRLLVLLFIVSSCGHLTSPDLMKEIEPDVESLAYSSIQKLIPNETSIKKTIEFSSKALSSKKFNINLKHANNRDVIIQIFSSGGTELATISNVPELNNTKYIPVKYINYIKNFVLTDFTLVHSKLEDINSQMRIYRATQIENIRNIKKLEKDFATIEYQKDDVILFNNTEHNYNLKITNN